MEHEERPGAFYDAQMIAELCHEANRAIQRQLGEQVNFPWENTSPDLRASALDGVQKILDGTIKTPEESHANWVIYKREQGWVYGEAKDFAKQEHPQLVPYEALPVEQQIKDAVFWAIVKALT